MIHRDELGYFKVEVVALSDLLLASPCLLAQVAIGQRLDGKSISALKPWLETTGISPWAMASMSELDWPSPGCDVGKMKKCIIFK